MVDFLAWKTKDGLSVLTCDASVPFLQLCPGCGRRPRAVHWRFIFRAGEINEHVIPNHNG